MPLSSRYNTVPSSRVLLGIVLAFLISIFISGGAFLCSSSSGGMVVGADAALPPISRVQLLSYAPHVFTGLVVDVEKTISHHNTQPEWSNNHYRLTIEVLSVVQTRAHTRTRMAELQGHPSDKGIDETLIARTLVYVYLWTMNTRPAGWTGDIGSSSVPAKGLAYGFYCHYMGSAASERSPFQQSYPYDPANPIRHGYVTLMPNGVGNVGDLNTATLLGDL